MHDHVRVGERARHMLYNPFPYNDLLIEIKNGEN